MGLLILMGLRLIVHATVALSERQPHGSRIVDVQHRPDEQDAGRGDQVGGLAIVERRRASLAHIDNVVRHRKAHYAVL